MTNPVSTRLRALRDIAQISPAELAHLAKLTEQNIGMLLEGSRGANISAKSAIAIARVFGATPEWLALGEGKRPTARRIKLSVAAARLGIRPKLTVLEDLVQRVAVLEEGFAQLTETAP